MKLKYALLLLLLVSANYFINESSSNAAYSASKTSIIKSSIYDNDEFSNLNINELYDEAKMNYEDNPDDYYSLANYIYASIKKQDVITAYNELLNITRNIYSNKVNYSFDELIPELERIKSHLLYDIKYDKNKSSIYGCIALIDIIRNDKDSTFLDIRRATNKAVNKELVFSLITIYYSLIGDDEKLIELCNSFIERNDLEADLLAELTYMKAFSLINLDRIDELKEEFPKIETAFRDYHPNEDLQYKIYLILNADKRKDKEIFDVLFPYNDGNIEQNYVDLYNLLISFNDKTSADKYAQIIEKKYPNSMTASLIKADRLQQEGSVEESKKLIQEAKDKVATETDIKKYNQSLANSSKNPIEEAVALFQQGLPDKALEILEDNPNVVENAFSLAFKARCCIDLDKMKKALEYLNKAIAYDAQSAFVNLQFGYYYYKTQDYKLARTYCRCN